MTNITVPEGLWSGDEKSASIITWLYSDGAQVNRDDIVAELAVEKATVEIVAPASGILRIAVEPEVPVGIGAVLATIE